MSDFLTGVAIQTRKRVDMEKAQMPLAQLKKRPVPPAASLRFSQALNRPGQLAIIAELKQASPSAGVIKTLPDVTQQIAAYERGGAAALSILTEEDYFHGSPEYLENARRHTKLPLLRKDFIIDPYQIVESRCLGADAILLIASLLPGSQLKEFIGLATESSLDALVEVHTEMELQHALQSGAKIIGINNRDLHTLKVDTTTAPKILAKVPKTGIQIVIESGLRSPAELPPLRDLGANAALIGETLMRSDNPESTVKEFVTSCRK